MQKHTYHAFQQFKTFLTDRNISYILQIIHSAHNWKNSFTYITPKNILFFLIFSRQTKSYCILNLYLPALVSYVLFPKNLNLICKQLFDNSNTMTKRKTVKGIGKKLFLSSGKIFVGKKKIENYQIFFEEIVRSFANRNG